MLRAAAAWVAAPVGLQKFLSRLHAFTSFHGDLVRVRGRLLQINSVALTAASTGFPRIEATLSVSAYMAAPVTSARRIATRRAS